VLFLGESDPREIGRRGSHDSILLVESRVR